MIGCDFPSPDGQSGCTIGMIVPILCTTEIKLDGDGYVDGSLFQETDAAAFYLMLRVVDPLVYCFF